jgi:hypothetical protein
VNGGWVLARWAAWVRTQRTADEPCLVGWPGRTVRSQGARLRGQPGPGAQRAGGRNAGDVADLGHQRHRGLLADAGEHVEAGTRGSGVARARRSRSGRVMIESMASMRARQSSTIARATGAGQG